MEIELLKNASKYTFIEAYKRLCEITLAQKLNPIDVVRIRPVLGLSHARTQVVSIEKCVIKQNEETNQNDETSQFLYYLNVNLPGLYGNASPLPKFFTEELIQASHKEHNEARVFLDLIHQRLYQLFFQAKTQHLPHYLDKGKENIHNFMFSMVGFRNQSWLEQFPDKAFILRNINLFRHQKGTAEGLRLLVKRLFKRAEVQVDECVPRCLLIENQQQLLLGQQANLLGSNTLLGDKMQDSQSKLMVRISPVSASEYNHWCINKDNWRAFKQLIKYFINQPLLVDVTMEIEPEDKFNLTLEHSGHLAFVLGRNSWLLGDSDGNKTATITAPLKLI